AGSAQTVILRYATGSYRGGHGYPSTATPPWQEERTMDLEALERRIRRLEDLEEIKQLKARYAAYCDANYDADALADLFTADAVWDGGMLGRNEGREAIRQFFRGSSQRIAFAIHNILSPIIEIEGDTAHGTWYLLQTCTYTDGNQAVWGAATY